MIILNAALHLLSVVEDALDMSRIENNQFQIVKESFNPKDCLDEILKVMQFQASQKNLYLKLNINSTVPLMIISDMKRYKQVLFNLIGNAFKFTFKGGITVSVDYDQVSKILSTSVQDTGLGIKED